MYNDLFSIGPFTIHGYGLMIGLGIIAALLVTLKRCKRFGLSEDAVLDIAILAVPGGFIGAKLLYLIVEFGNIISGKFTISNLLTGFVVYGGIIGGVVTAMIYCRVKKIKFLKYFDLILPAVALAQGFGRVGCFLAGCCYGKETNSIFGIVFEHSEFAPNGVKLLPTQLISSAGNFIFAGILFAMARKNKKDGRVGSMYLILYGVGRFLIEFLRDDPRGSVGFLSTSQFISLFIVAAGIVLYVIFGRRPDAEPAAKEEETDDESGSEEDTDDGSEDGTEDNVEDDIEVDIKDNKEVRIESGIEDAAENGRNAEKDGSSDKGTNGGA